MKTSTSQTTCNSPGYNTSEEHIVVLGIGNVLWADEGFGVRCVETLQREWTFAPHVELVDGGTQGLYLIENVQSATKLMIFDAIDYGLAPGTLKLIENDEVPRFMGAKKMSLHQTGFQEVLCLAQFMGHYPEQVVLIGCQPEELDDFGGSLRASVKQSMPRALALGIERLRDWGAAPRMRAQPLPIDATLTGAMLTLERYESERPGVEQACRIGDARFIPKVA
ncbi:MAG: HyaD/HybD family hydrogenase maturation endopeptidase [Polaromonas sp.]|nr:HyaD/HybD family hydrogenase maturation endopeptidase [Polaromonas sp.]